jgi:hypothetical protein
MPSAIPAALAPYLDSSLSIPHSQLLVTSILSTPSPWLLVSFIFANLYGARDDGENQYVGAPGEQAGEVRRPAVFLSFLRPLSLWVEMGKKMVRSLSSLPSSSLNARVDHRPQGVRAHREGKLTRLTRVSISTHCSQAEKLSISMGSRADCLQGRKIHPFHPRLGRKV